jgi:hypothetical protein
MKARAILLECRVTSPLEELKFLDCLKIDYSLLFSFVEKKHVVIFVLVSAHHTLSFGISV